jgi:hypothetical protein
LHKQKATCNCKMKYKYNDHRGISINELKMLDNCEFNK